jgi:hypothetical protein
MADMELQAHPLLTGDLRCGFCNATIPVEGEVKGGLTACPSCRFVLTVTDETAQVANRQYRAAFGSRPTVSRKGSDG